MATQDRWADEELQARLASGLAAVEDMLQTNVSTPDAFIEAAASHLIQAGGKRFRPQLCLLAAQYGDPEAAGVIEVATVVELTHLATLYHDDVMDEAALRRGSPSANARFGNSMAILTGDFLFARASLLLSTLGSELVSLQAATIERLVSGQIHETQGPADGEDPVEHYLRVAGDKTASLVAASARMGAQVAGADPQVVQTLAQIGELMGLAFQLADDLLDVVSEAPGWGKAPGTDLREGVASLPLVLARQPDVATCPGWSAAQQAQLTQLLEADLSDEHLHRQALELLRRSPAVEATRQRMHELSAQAQQLVDTLPPGPASHALSALCDQVVSRQA
jgi:heptaprenyl diphosphate synthase